MTVKSSISLTDDQHAFARALVDAGQFPSVSAVLQHGVELLRQRLEDDAMEREALRDVLARRRAGPIISSAEFDKRLAEMISAKRRQYGVQS